MTNRRKFIVDMVNKYEKDYACEYAKFLEMIEWKRVQLADKKFGSFDKEMRSAAMLPDKLYNLLIYVLNGSDEEKLFEPKGEMKWFIKKFPEYLLPREY